MFSISGILNILVSLINVAIPVVGAVLIATRVTGPARKLGVTGCAVLAGTGLLQTIWIYVGPQLARRSGSSIAMLYGTVGLVFTILSALGLILVIAAVVAGRSGSRPPVATPGPNPYQSYPPAGPAPGYGPPR